MQEATKQRLITFFSKYKTVSYSAGEIIYRPNETINQVGFINKGYLRIYNYDQDGKEITYSGFKPIFLLSYLYAKKNINNQYYLEALTDLEIWKSPIEDFELFLNDNKDLVFDILDNSLLTLQSILYAWENSFSGDAYVRIAKLLLSLGKEYGKVIGEKLEIDFKTTHRLIASMLGITRETASVQIKKLENDGWITQNDSIILINKPQEMQEKFV